MSEFINKMWSPNEDVVKIKKLKRHQGKSSSTPTASEEEMRGDSESQWDSLVLIMWISRLFGTAPVRFQKSSGCPVAVSNVVDIYCKFVAIVLNAGIMIGTIIDWQAGSRGIRVREGWTCVSWFAEWILMVTIITIGVFWAPRRLQRSITHLNAVYEIKSNIEFPKGYKSTKSSNYAISVYVISVIVLFTVEFNSYLFSALDQGKELMVLYFYWILNAEMIMTMMLEMQFMWVAMFVRSGLKSVNNAMEGLIYFIDVQRATTMTNEDDCMDVDASYIPRPVPPVNTIVDTMAPKSCFIVPRHPHLSKYVPESIHALTCAYGNICNIVVGLNDDYGLLLVLFLALITLRFIITPFNFLHFYYSCNPRIINLIVQVLMLPCHFSFMLLVVEPGYLAEKENERTQTLARQLLQRVSLVQDPMIAELNILLQHIKLNKVYYSPLNLCRLSRSLITAILGGSTTYLVIVLQYQSMNETFGW